MSNHGCRFDWCTNPDRSCDPQRFEHFQHPEYVPATGNSLNGIHSERRSLGEEMLPTVAVGARWNEDLEPGPTVYVEVVGDHPSGGIVLRTDEAILLHRALGRAIINASKGTNLSSKRIARFYGEDRL